MNTQAFYRFAAVALCLFAPACSSPDYSRGAPLPQMTFAHLTPISVAVRNVDINKAKEGPVADGFVIDPMQAAENYLQSRFVAYGQQDTLAAMIEEASVTKSHKESGDKMARFFEVAGKDVYNVKLRIRIEHTDDSGRALYGKVLEARRAMHINEHASVAEREKYQLEGMEAMFRDLDREVQNLVVDGMRLGMIH